MKKFLFYAFDIKDLIPLAGGILAGFILAFLLYLVVLIKSIKKDVRKVSTKERPKEEDIIKIIEMQVKKYKDNDVIKYHQENEQNHYKEIVLELLDLLAKRYYPHSKHPTLEITLDEALLLGHYVLNRVSKILEKRIFALFKTTSMASIYAVYKKTNSVANMQIIKKTKKPFLIIKKVIDAVNPLKLVKKVTIDAVTSKLIKYLCIQTIYIIGEEFYHVYSKKIIESDLVEFIDEDEL